MVEEMTKFSRKHNRSRFRKKSVGGACPQPRLVPDGAFPPPLAARKIIFFIKIWKRKRDDNQDVIKAGRRGAKKKENK